MRPLKLIKWFLILSFLDIIPSLNSQSSTTTTTTTTTTTPTTTTTTTPTTTTTTTPTTTTTTTPTTTTTGTTTKKPVVKCIKPGKKCHKPPNQPKKHLRCCQKPKKHICRKDINNKGPYKCRLPKKKATAAKREIPKFKFEDFFY